MTTPELSIPGTGRRICAFQQSRHCSVDITGGELDGVRDGREIMTIFRFGGLSHRGFRSEDDGRAMKKEPYGYMVNH